MKVNTFFIRVAKTVGLVLYDNLDDLSRLLFVPKSVSFILSNLPANPTNWYFVNLLVKKSVDGAILGKFFIPNKNLGWKAAIRKGLPVENEKTLAIENEPHVLDGFNGVIEHGYGKGTKKIIFKGQAILKVKGQSKVTDIEYHIHQADKAGLHYDLAVKGLKSNEDLFELNIGKGPIKGRYSFAKTDRGYIIGRMKDRGIALAKPSYKLKSEELLSTIGPNVIIERKLDGSLGNVLIRDNRAIIHSHRDNSNTYYDKLPSIEFLQNKSPILLYRKFFPGPDLEGTIIKVELVHPDGISIVSGILNSSADNAINVQAKIGDVIPFAWDIVKLKGKDLSRVPYSVRRIMLEQVIKQIRLYNKNWQIVEKCPEGMSANDFYKYVINDRRGLPYSEGIVVKPFESTVEDSWIKVKRHDLVDMMVIAFQEGEGRLEGSLGAILAKDLETGKIAVVGTGFSDFQRNWIWKNRDLLEEAVIKTKVFTETNESFRAPRFIEFHESKGNNEYGLLMYADTLSGLNSKELMIDTKYALINSH